MWGPGENGGERRRRKGRQVAARGGVGRASRRELTLMGEGTNPPLTSRPSWGQCNKGISRGEGGR